MRLADVAVLVVDDDRLLRYAVARVLSGAGARVREAGDGPAAILLAGAAPLDVLLTDMEMPGLDGAAVALEVTARFPGVVVVFMSGRSQDVHIANGRLRADDRLIEKPFTPDELLDAVATALASEARRPRPPR